MNTLTKIRKKIVLDKYDLILFFLTFVSFLAVLYILYPGILTYDSYTQLKQIETGTFSDWHPFIHTFIEMICLKLRNNPSSIAIFQILFFSLLWTSICKYNRKNKKIFIYEIVITIFICLNPLNPLYSITLWKDILYCYNILLLCFIVEIVYDKKFQITNKLLAFLAIVMAFTYSLRYNGKIVIGLSLVVLIFTLYKKDKISKNYLKLPIFTLIGILCIQSLNFIYHVETNQKDALSQKIVQYIGAFAKEDVIKDEDKKIISNYVNLEELANYYNPYYADTIYECDFSEDIYLKYKKYTYHTVLNYTFKYPKIFLDFALKSTSLIWQIPSPDDMVGTTIETGVAATNNYKGLLPRNYGKNYYEKYQDFLSFTKNNKIVSTLLYNAALYFYLSVIVFLFILKKFKKNCFIIIFPSIANIISTIPSLPVQDTRYLYNNFLIFYLIIIIYIKIKWEVKNETKASKVS